LAQAASQSNGGSNSFFGNGAGGANRDGTDNNSHFRHERRFIHDLKFHLIFGAFAGEMNSTGSFNAISLWAAQV
jgi:hypothetical protein